MNARSRAQNRRAVRPAETFISTTTTRPPDVWTPRGGRSSTVTTAASARITPAAASQRRGCERPLLSSGIALRVRLRDDLDARFGHPLEKFGRRSERLAAHGNGITIAMFVASR